jgi:hypothetical protein
MRGFKVEAKKNEITLKRGLFGAEVKELAPMLMQSMHMELL